MTYDNPRDVIVSTFRESARLGHHKSYLLNFFFFVIS
jgi:hypothetical protein